MEDLRLIVGVISNLGFPIFVAVWLLYSTNRFIQDNTRALEKLITLIDKCTKE